MRTLASLALTAILLTSCSTTNDRASDAVNSSASGRTEIDIAQMSAVPDTARNTSGGVPIQYRMRFTNRGDQSITLKRVTLQSVGEGAYSLTSTSRPFDVAIAAGQATETEFWVATQSSGSLSGVNGPVTLRATVIFDSATGQFQEIVTRQVSGNSIR